MRRQSVKLASEHFRRRTSARESSFALLQKNVLNKKSRLTRDELRSVIVTWSKQIYHRRRRRVHFKISAPIEYEAIMNMTAAFTG